MTGLIAVVRLHWKPFALVVAPLLLLSALVWGSRVQRRHRLATQQAQASQAHAQAVAAAASRYRAYQLDSTRQATERRQLLENAHLQHERNETLRRHRPALIALPEHPPRP